MPRRTVSTSRILELLSLQILPRSLHLHVHLDSSHNRRNNNRNNNKKKKGVDNASHELSAIQQIAHAWARINHQYHHPIHLKSRSLHLIRPCIYHRHHKPDRHTRPRLRRKCTKQKQDRGRSRRPKWKRNDADTGWINAQQAPLKSSDTPQVPPPLQSGPSDEKPYARSRTPDRGKPYSETPQVRRRTRDPLRKKRRNQIHLNLIRLKLVVYQGPRPRRLKLEDRNQRRLKLEDNHQKRPSPNLVPFKGQSHGSEREFLMRRKFPRKAL